MSAVLTVAALTVIAPASGTVPFAARQSTTSVTSVTVDTSGTPANTYRVPSAAVTNDGALIVCYDSRNLSSADLPADIDIVCKNSTDGGITFGARRIAVAHTGGNTDGTAYGVGDSQLTYDAASGALFLFYLAAPPGVGLSNSSTDTNPASTTTVHLVYRTSTDDGSTWSPAVDLTGVAKTPGSVTGVFASSGHGVVTDTGELIIPYAFIKNGSSITGLLSSTNGGATWAQQTIGVAGNENKIAALSNGSLLDDVRSNAGGPLYRQFATRGGSGWSTAVIETSLPDPLSNGDIVRVDPIGGQTDSTWLLESNPDSQTTRVNGAIRLSRDNGATWPYAWNVEPNAFGYSTMVRFRDGTFGICYEHTVSDNGRSLVFTHFSMAQFPS